MIKTQELPEWRQLATDSTADNAFEVISVAFAREEKFYFDGVIGSLLGLGRIPKSIEISLDAEEMSCVARLNYGDCSDEHAAYAPFEVESFALLWNANPDMIHGIEGERVILSLNPSTVKYPIITGFGELADLYLKDDLFVISPNLDSDAELDEAA